MELDDLKHAWQTLGQRLERQEAIQWQLLKERRLDSVRRHLRPLVWGQLLQFLLGIALLLLGVACWTRNTDVPGLFATGIALHAFGVLTVAMAALTITLARTVDYAAPVMAIQKQLARLLRCYTLNAGLCGAPWWVAWVLVVVAFAGLGEVDRAADTPGWIVASVAIGIVGTLATWAWMLRAQRRGTRDAADRHAAVADGGDGIRRSRRVLDEIARFERD